jgi:hypothetical protein
MKAGEVLPRTYTREELLSYLQYCRRKYRETIGALSFEQAYRLRLFPWGELPFAELLLYNMRHVQEYAAQNCTCSWDSRRENPQDRYSSPGFPFRITKGNLVLLTI